MPEQLSHDQLVRRIAARTGQTLAAVAEDLRHKPHLTNLLADAVAGDAEPPAIDPVPDALRGDPAAGGEPVNAGDLASSPVPAAAPAAEESRA